MSENKVKGNVRLYACGGLGFNLGSQLEHFRNNTLPGVANLEIAYIDTADSNMKPNISDDDVYFIKGVDGSGQVRKENHVAIGANVPAILQKFPPGELSITLSSGSGGSGSVAAPKIVSELLARGENVLSIVVGDISTNKFISNTADTVESFTGVSKARSKPLGLTYFQNGGKVRQSTIDETIIGLIGSLCVLFSRQNHGLDSRDLHNFLYFSENSVTSYGPRLAQLNLVEGNQSFDGLGSVISVATLATETSGSALPLRPDVQFVGQLPADADNIIAGNAPIHFIISAGNFAGVHKELKAMLAERDSVRRADVDHSEVKVDLSSAGDDGVTV